MKKDMHSAEFDSAEQEILSLLQKIQQDVDGADNTSEETEVSDLFEEDEAEGALPVAPDAPDADLADLPLIFSFADETPDEQPAPSRKKAAPRKKNVEEQQVEPASQLVSSPEQPQEKKPSRFANMMRNLIPLKGDAAGEVVRKCVFLVSLIVFIGSLGFLGYFMILEPQQVKSDNQYYASLYNDKSGNEDNKDAYDYPAGMQPSFRQLYDVNKDIAGWLSYVSSDADTFLNIDLPVVHCDNNDTYLNHAFDGTKSRSGTLFFDASNTIEQGVTNKVSIIYGHNMASGAMFANLNKLIGNVYRARSAPYITLNTIYENQQYLVFAVIVCDEGAEQGRRFGYLRNTFADDTDFLNYVNELRARSLFDYPVDVNADDELLILSTCTNRNQVKFGDGRLAVIARRVRDDKDGLVDTTKIVKNDDVIMPYAWYTAQDLTPHAFYTQADYHIPEDSTVHTTTGTAGTATTTTTDGTTTTAGTDGSTTATGQTTASVTTTTATTQADSGQSTGGQTTTGTQSTDGEQTTGDGQITGSSQSDGGEQDTTGTQGTSDDQNAETTQA